MKDSVIVGVRNGAQANVLFWMASLGSLVFSFALNWVTLWLVNCLLRFDPFFWVVHQDLSKKGLKQSKLLVRVFRGCLNNLSSCVNNQQGLNQVWQDWSHRGGPSSAPGEAPLTPGWGGMEWNGIEWGGHCPEFCPAPKGGTAPSFMHFAM